MLCFEHLADAHTTSPSAALTDVAAIVSAVNCNYSIKDWTATPCPSPGSGHR